MKSKNLTLSLDADLLEAGRRYAKAQGSSLNAVIRSFLRSAVLGDEASRSGDELMDALESAEGDSGGKRWKREDAYQG